MTEKISLIDSSIIIIYLVGILVIGVLSVRLKKMTSDGYFLAGRGLNWVIGQGTVFWVFISEIFPNDHRAAGQSLGSFTHWIFAALLTLLFPIAIKNFDAGYIFAFFAFMMILQLIWMEVMVPETKGRSLEEIEKKLRRN